MNRKIISEWLDCWNANNLDGCAELLDNSVELISTNIVRLFPDSKGVIKGKVTALKYFQIVFEKYPLIKLRINNLHQSDDYVILDSYSENDISCHVQYFINSSNLIYKMKADISEL